jgi:hypothetical protein
MEEIPVYARLRRSTRLWLPMLPHEREHIRLMLGTRVRELTKSEREYAVQLEVVDHDLLGPGRCWNCGSRVEAKEATSA